MKNYIKGNYRKSIFSSPKGYVIGLFKVKDTNDERLVDYVNKMITFTGYFHELNEDDNYIFYGEGIEHPKYGFQFQVSEYEKIKPEDKDGVIEFLASDLFPGIGEKQATLIVDVLGEKALDKILEDASCLSLVPKLSSKKAKKIYDILVKYEESHKTVIYLSELGFNLKEALVIYNLYKQNTIMNIEHNIYTLLDDLEIPFSKIDMVRLKLEIPDDDERRIKAGIYAALKGLTFKTGNTYFLLEEIILEASQLLKINLYSEDVVLYLDELRYQGKVKKEDDKYFLMDIFPIMLYNKESFINKIKGILLHEK